MLTASRRLIGAPTPAMRRDLRRSAMIQQRQNSFTVRLWMSTEEIPPEKRVEVLKSVRTWVDGRWYCILCHLHADALDHCANSELYHADLFDIFYRDRNSRRQECIDNMKTALQLVKLQPNWEADPHARDHVAVLNRALQVGLDDLLGPVDQ
jgi:hypothetical protein